MKTFIAIAALIGTSSFGLITAAEAQSPAAKIGEATLVKNNVVIVSGTSQKDIAPGSPVRTMETVVTGADSSSELVLMDQTKLAVGPNSKLLLDKFVYDPDPNKRKIVLTNLKGALRFVTGKNPSKTYEIRTPTATIGVRGTMFDIYVGDDGVTTVGLLKGRVNICPPGSRKCRDLLSPGKFLSADRRGRLVITTHPTAAMMGGLVFSQAFPFLSGRIRLRGDGLVAPLAIQNRILRKMGLPKLRGLPGLRGKTIRGPGGIKIPILNGPDIFGGDKRIKKRKHKRKNYRRKQRRRNLRLR